MRFRVPGGHIPRENDAQKVTGVQLITTWDGRRGRSYLENCWLPRKLFERWCAWHHLPKSRAFPAFAREPGPRFARRCEAFTRISDACANISPAASVEV